MNENDDRLLPQQTAHAKYQANVSLNGVSQNLSLEAATQVMGNSQYGIYVVKAPKEAHPNGPQSANEDIIPPQLSKFAERPASPLMRRVVYGPWKRNDTDTPGSNSYPLSDIQDGYSCNSRNNNGQGLDGTYLSSGKFGKAYNRWESTMVSNYLKVKEGSSTPMVDALLIGSKSSIQTTLPVSKINDAIPRYQVTNVGNVITDVCQFPREWNDETRPCTRQKATQACPQQWTNTGKRWCWTGEDDDGRWVRRKMEEDEQRCGCVRIGGNDDGRWIRCGSTKIPCQIECSHVETSCGDDYVERWIREGNSFGGCGEETHTGCPVDCDNNPWVVGGFPSRKEYNTEYDTARWKQPGKEYWPDDTDFRIGGGYGPWGRSDVDEPGGFTDGFGGGNDYMVNRAVGDDNGIRGKSKWGKTNGPVDVPRYAGPGGRNPVHDIDTDTEPPTLYPSSKQPKANKGFDEPNSYDPSIMSPGYPGVHDPQYNPDVDMARVPPSWSGHDYSEAIQKPQVSVKPIPRSQSLPTPRRMDSPAGTPDFTGGKGNQSKPTLKRNSHDPSPTHGQPSKKQNESEYPPSNMPPGLETDVQPGPYQANVPSRRQPSIIDVHMSNPPIGKRTGDPPILMANRKSLNKFKQDANSPKDPNGQTDRHNPNFSDPRLPQTADPQSYHPNPDSSNHHSPLTADPQSYHPNPDSSNPRSPKTSDPKSYHHNPDSSNHHSPKNSDPQSYHPNPDSSNPRSPKTSNPQSYRHNPDSSNHRSPKNSDPQSNHHNSDSSNHRSSKNSDPRSNHHNPDSSNHRSPKNSDPRSYPHNPDSSNHRSPTNSDPQSNHHNPDSSNPPSPTTSDPQSYYYNPDSNSSNHRSPKNSDPQSYHHNPHGHPSLHYSSHHPEPVSHHNSHHTFRKRSPKRHPIDAGELHYRNLDLVQTIDLEHALTIQGQAHLIPRKSSTSEIVPDPIPSHHNTDWVLNVDNSRTSNTPPTSRHSPRTSVSKRSSHHTHQSPSRAKHIQPTHSRTSTFKAPAPNQRNHFPANKPSTTTNQRHNTLEASHHPSKTTRKSVTSFHPQIPTKRPSASDHQHNPSNQKRTKSPQQQGNVRFSM